MAELNYFVHQKGLVESKTVGTGTRVWAFAHIAEGATVGKDCNICDHTFVENGAIIGDNVTLKCGVYVWNGVELKNDVFVGPNVAFTNDKNPRSRQWLEAPFKTVVEEFVSIGAGAAIRCGITIGKCALIAMGAVVLENVAPYTMVAGVPAKFKYYICKCGNKLQLSDNFSAECKCGNKYKLSDKKNSCFGEII